MPIQRLLDRLADLEAKGQHLLIAATGNDFKIKEIKRNLDNPQWDIIGLKELAGLIECDFALLDSKESELDMPTIARGKVTLVQEFIKKQLHAADMMDSPLINQLLWMSDDYGVKWESMRFEAHDHAPIKVNYGLDGDSIESVATNRPDLVGTGVPGLFAHRLLIAIAQEKFPELWQQNQSDAEDRALELFARTMINIAAVRNSMAVDCIPDCIARVCMAWAHGLKQVSVVEKAMPLYTPAELGKVGYLYDRMMAVGTETNGALSLKTIGAHSDQDRDAQLVRGVAFKELTHAFHAAVNPTRLSAPAISIEDIDAAAAPSLKQAA